MSIKDLTEKIKLFFSDIKDKIYSQEKGLKIKDDLYIVIMIILVATASFGLGKLSSYEKSRTPISIINTRNAIYKDVFDTGLSSSTKNQLPVNQPVQVSGEVVASKSGTKYYYPWCSGVSKIKEDNKVWFKSIEDAKLAGLTPASNCVGLK